MTTEKRDSLPARTDIGAARTTPPIVCPACRNKDTHTAVIIGGYVRYCRCGWEAQAQH